MVTRRTPASVVGSGDTSANRLVMSGHLLGRELQVREDAGDKRGDDVPLVGLATSMVGPWSRSLRGEIGGPLDRAGVQICADELLGGLARVDGGRTHPGEPDSGSSYLVAGEFE